MTNEIPVHITFSESAAGSLMSALKRLGRTDRVLPLADNLGIGPINPPDPRSRDAWRLETLGDAANDLLVASTEAFWRTLSSIRTDIVAWISTRYVTEYCGFLELLGRAAAPVRVVDVAQMEFAGRDGRPDPYPSQAFSCMRDDLIVSHGLLARAVPASPEARVTWSREWSQLREDNAALRVLTENGLISAPVDHFDDMLLSLVGDDWQTCARVVGNALNRMSSGTHRQACDDTFVFARLLTLMDNEILEGKNERDTWSIHESWVRRPVSPPRSQSA